MKDYIKSLTTHPLFKRSIIYTITDAINKAIPFLVLPVLTYYLTPADYGIVANYTVYTAILLIFVGLNMNGAMAANFYGMNRGEMSSYVFNVFLITIISAVICSFIIFVLRKPIYNNTSIPAFFLLTGILVALAQAITTINLDLWRLEEKPFNFGVYQILQSILNVSLTVVLVIIYKMSWQGRLEAIIITVIVFALFSLVILYRRGYLRFKLRREYISDALKFGMPMIPHTLGIWIRTGIDRIFVTKLYGTAEAGLYATGFQFGLLMSFLVMAFHNAYTPYIYKMLSDESEEKKNKIVKFTYAYFLGVLLLALIFTIVSIFVVRFFLSKQYLASSKYVGWAMFAQAFQGMYFMVGIYIFYAKKTSKLAIATTIIALAQLALSYLLIKYIGPIGAAYSSCIIGFLNFLVVWFFSSKAFPMPWFNFRKLRNG